MAAEWFWEGNIVTTLCDYLKTEGWTIDSTANTEKREHGVDIRAAKNNRTLLIEVKGYPSALYQQGDKRGQRKKTHSATQARHWYSQALLSAILLEATYPDAIVAIAFPNISTFTTLAKKTRHALDKLDIFVYFVSESGFVEIINPV